MAKKRAQQVERLSTEVKGLKSVVLIAKRESAQARDQAAGALTAHAASNRKVNELESKAAEASKQQHAELTEVHQQALIVAEERLAAVKQKMREGICPRPGEHTAKSFPKLSDWQAFRPVA
eukprot:5799343-Pleurochrysis_carterae.AAC.1